MLNTGDRVSKEVWSLCATIKENIQNTLAEEVREQRLVLTHVDIDKINTIVGNTTDVIFNRAIDKVVAIVETELQTRPPAEAPVATKQDAAINAKAKKFVKKMAKK